MKLEGINDWPKVAQLAAVSSICGNEITVATGVIFLMRKSWNAPSIFRLEVPPPQHASLFLGAALLQDATRQVIT